MLEPAKIDKIVGEVATVHLKRRNFERVTSKATVDSEGEEAVRITIVLKPGALDRLKGDPVFDTLVEIHHRLRAAGEERFPLVEYATQAELDEDASPES